jgi:uncharacterized DUF497 family protein
MFPSDYLAPPASFVALVALPVETEITDNIIKIISARKANRNEREKYNGENNLS